MKYPLSFDPPLSKKQIADLLKTLENGTIEWTRKGGERNILERCLNDCVYCYARNMAHRSKRVPFSEWGENPIVCLERCHIPKRIHNHIENKWDFMFPTASDIFPNTEKIKYYDYYLLKFKEILEKGYTLLITTKPRIEVIKNLCHDLEPYKKNIAFRFTITSVNDNILNALERKASSFEERLESLSLAHDLGFNTTISIEPLLDPTPFELIDRVKPYLSKLDIQRDIGSIWVGLFKTKYTPKWFIEKYNLQTIYKEIKQSQSFKNVYEWYSELISVPFIRMKESVKKLMLRNNIRIF